MVSDIVLLKELPDFIKNSIAAYIGCVSGAIGRNEYLGAIKAAGFQETRVIDETPDNWASDDVVVREFAESLKIPPEEVKKVANSVVSIKVYGVKPN